MSASNLVHSDIEVMRGHKLVTYDDEVYITLLVD